MARKKKRKIAVTEKKKSFFETKYKQLLIIPISLLILSLVIIGFQIATTGDFADKSVSLKGGLTFTVFADNLNSDVVESFLKNEFPNSDINIRSITELGRVSGIIIETADLSEEQLVNSLNSKIPNLEDNYSVETIGASLGESFFRQIIIAIIIAFVFMAIVVFIYFRTLVPSAAVVLAAFSDIIITLAVLNILDIKLTTAGIAAFLMLIGYSVDTDILLTTRVLKRGEGTVYQRVVGAMKTGLVMNFTTMAAVLIALLLSQSDIIRQIMTILFIGLLADLVNTWIQNAGILRWYMEK